MKKQQREDDKFCIQSEVLQMRKYKTSEFIGILVFLSKPGGGGTTP